MTRSIRNFTRAALASTFLLAAPACAHAEASPTAGAEAASPAEPTGPALWQVADEDTTIYLFGTVHALPKEVEWFNGPIAEALESSDILVTEVIMDSASQAKMQQVVMTTATLPEGQTLRGMLDDEQRATYEAAIGKIGLPPESFDRFEPWYASLMFAMIPLMQQGYAREAGVENVLETATGGEMARGELETIEYQLSLFDSLSMDMQLAYMMETIEMIDDIKPSLDAMVAEWLEGDADALADLMNEGLTQRELLEVLLFQRNRAWAEWIDNRLDTPGTVFLAVGAGHLAGDESVQEVLAKRGIVTTRLQ